MTNEFEKQILEELYELAINDIESVPFEYTQDHTSTEAMNKLIELGFVEALEGSYYKITQLGIGAYLYGIENANIILKEGIL